MVKNARLILIMHIYILIIIISSCNKDGEKSNIPPTCEITTPTNGQEIARDETVTISVTANDSDGNIVEVRFFINNEEKSSVTNSPYNYVWNTTGESTGNHKVKATSIDNNGSSTEDEVTILITKDGSGNLPDANFTANITSGIATFTVNFTDLSTNNTTNWKWDFGDNDTNALQNPTHTFINDGYYSVSLTASNNYGTDTIIKINYIYIGNGGIDGEPCPGMPTVSDADGNMYNTVIIGNRCWMKENLRVGTFLQGKYNMSDNGVIEKYCYNNSLIYCQTYGALYQWDEMMQYTSQAGAQGICPEGWHLPSDDEWKQLEMHLGMDQSQADMVGYRGTDEGNKLKSDIGWSNNGNGSNSINFSAVPGGYRHAGKSFRYLSKSGSWWSSSEHRSLRVWRRGLYHDNGMVRRNHHDKMDGLSVKCVRD